MQKRKQDNKSSEQPQTELTQRFKEYSMQYDELIDLYERLVKKSRDITLGSKRLIFALHRLKPGSDIRKEISQQLLQVRELIGQVAKDIEGKGFWKFHRAFSPGIQEYIEAATFLGFLETGTLISRETLQEELKPFTLLQIITLDDYLLGVGDLTGEMMRLAVRSVTQGEFDLCNNICVFLRNLYLQFKQLPNNHIDELDKKISVMSSSVEKVENVNCMLQLKGTEYPKEVLKHFLAEQDDETS